jgi:TadE-like protein
MMRTLKSNMNRERGTAAVEFAMLAPVMLIMAFGLLEVGRMLFDYQAINSGVRVAARYLSRVPLDCSGVNTAPVQAARNIAYTGTPDGSGDRLVSYWDGSGAQLSVTLNCTPNYPHVSCAPWNGTPAIGPDPGRTPPLCTQITVTATVPFPLITMLPLGIGPNITLTAEHREVNFGG